MILVIDTETTGLPDFNKRASDPSQPHIVQFAALLMDDSGLKIDTHNFLCKPDGWTIPKEASDIHGITDAIANAKGIPEKEVAAICLGLIREASVVVAHNIMFDKFIMRIALRRYGILQDSHDAWWKGLNTFCTMRAMENVCCLPGKYRGKYKWPTLAEAYRHAFDEEMLGAHGAEADVRACLRLYRWLMERKGAVAS
jgi:DNA polymerase-3 subunit epsilon